MMSSRTGASNDRRRSRARRRKSRIPEERARRRELTEGRHDDERQRKTAGGEMVAGLPLFALVPLEATALTGDVGVDGYDRLERRPAAERGDERGQAAKETELIRLEIVGFNADLPANACSAASALARVSPSSPSSERRRLRRPEALHRCRWSSHAAPLVQPPPSVVVATVGIARRSSTSSTPPFPPKIAGTPPSSLTQSSPPLRPRRRRHPSSFAVIQELGEFAASPSTRWCPPFASPRHRLPASTRCRAATGDDVIVDVSRRPVVD
uniref:Uncharacterized protein n=1 Tax=Oryza sativa subsp. japonica TaxID=39947 RepID=Q8H373_ORYSJ|nr:hypothetical protein [Oryza sativa Japonica Group]